MWTLSLSRYLRSRQLSSAPSELLLNFESTRGYYIYRIGTSVISCSVYCYYNSLAQYTWTDYTDPSGFWLISDTSATNLNTSRNPATEHTARASVDTTTTVAVLISVASYCAVHASRMCELRPQHVSKRTSVFVRFRQFYIFIFWIFCIGFVLFFTFIIFLYFLILCLVIDWFIYLYVFNIGIAYNTNVHENKNNNHKII